MIVTKTLDTSVTLLIAKITELGEPATAWMPSGTTARICPVANIFDRQFNLIALPIESAPFIVGMNENVTKLIC
jgi:hypothetical protein